LYIRTVIVMLLFTVAGLATLAKNAQYYPDSNPAQHISVSTKMNVAHSPAHVAEAPLELATLPMPPKPPVRAVRALSEEALPSPPIGVTVSMQHRSPPSALA